MAGGGTTSRALVLGGGGIAGVAWEIGLLSGLAGAAASTCARADLVVGTSAGSVVGALVTRRPGPGGALRRPARARARPTSRRSTSTRWR